MSFVLAISRLGKAMLSNGRLLACKAPMTGSVRARDTPCCPPAWRQIPPVHSASASAAALPAAPPGTLPSRNSLLNFFEPPAFAYSAQNTPGTQVPELRRPQGQHPCVIKIERFSNQGEPWQLSDATLWHHRLQVIQHENNLANMCIMALALAKCSSQSQVLS